MQGHLSLGSTPAALRLYNACSIKHVQQETLTYVVLPAMVQVGGAAQAEQPLDAAARFRRDGMRDMQEALGLAFRSGNYTQAAEMATFRHTLERSWWRRLLEATELLLLLQREAANAAAVQLALAGASVTELDVSLAGLAALPDVLDAKVYEARLPVGRGAGVHALRYSWLPRRVLLLRLLRSCLAAGSLIPRQRKPSIPLDPPPPIFLRHRRRRLVGDGAGFARRVRSRRRPFVCAAVRGCRRCRRLRDALGRGG